MLSGERAAEWVRSSCCGSRSVRLVASQFEHPISHRMASPPKQAVADARIGTVPLSSPKRDTIITVPLLNTMYWDLVNLIAL